MIHLARRSFLASSALALIAVHQGLVNPLLAASPGVENQSTGARYGKLAEALAAARPGDHLSVTGHHLGQFTLDKSLTLRGDASAVLDAGGQGTALVVNADDVQLERLLITGSGQTNSYRTIWGDAGLRIAARRVRLDGIKVTGNDDGIVVLGGEHVHLTGVQVSGNRGAGVKLFGGAAHRIENCVINGNKIGVYVDALYEGGTLTEIVVPEINDPVSLERTSRIKETSVHASSHRIENNIMRGNEVFGISLCWNTHDCTVAGNDVSATGIERPVTEEATRYWEQVLSATTGADVTLDMAMLGTGIMLICFAHDNAVVTNSSHDNLGYGIALHSTAKANRVEGNRVERNRIGLDLGGALQNAILGNLVAQNRDFGIRVDVLSSPVPTGGPSDGNRLVGNAMLGNGVNAFDSSDTVMTLADFDQLIDQMPWPEPVREQMAVNPALRSMMAQQMLAAHKPGRNAWDDGARGNYFDDFDAPAEGFADADGNGIGERPHPIPGGGAVDRFPLAQPPG